MPVRFTINSRKDFILFGKVVADVLRNHDPDKQWVIRLQGHTNGGKSVLPLAADLERNPHRYRIGIRRYHFVHRMAHHHHPEHYPRHTFRWRDTSHLLAPHQAGEEKIYFNDGLGQIKFDQGAVAQQWQRLLDTMPNTKLIYLSNVAKCTELRTGGNAVADPDKIAIDMWISVEIIKGKRFSRNIEYTTGDDELDKKIQARFDREFKTLHPTKPQRKRKGPRPTEPDGSR